MRVIRAKSAGFCLGVSLALRALDEELAALEKAAEHAAPSGSINTRRRLVTLGPIIHNPLVMGEYSAKGVFCQNTPEGLTPADTVIIRAHGVPRELEAQLAASGALVRDATCPKVKKAQLAIAEQKKRGGTLLLFGEADHPEVRGLLSYAGHDALVFGSLEELEALPLHEGHAYFLAAQTTQDKALFLEATDVVARRLGRDTPVLRTICDATRKRQEEALALAENVEAMVVVGGLNSGNTRRLAELARARGVPTVHVEQVEDLLEDALRGLNVVGLTAGASTPEAHIAAMEAYLLSL